VELAVDPEYDGFPSRYARYALARITRDSRLREFGRALDDSWNKNLSGGWRYTEEEQMNLFRQWWKENKSRYTPE
jgi:hypothetical protein